VLANAGKASHVVAGSYFLILGFEDPAPGVPPWMRDATSQIDRRHDADLDEPFP
jgi:hypothetical protein|tara:strand:- start:1282 stop:1443 length:162 start_codon:yes stop_codon:yes gene_type:complete